MRRRVQRSRGCPVAGHLLQGAASARRARFAAYPQRSGKNARASREKACVAGEITYLSPCPNRTCLWSCVGGRGSGQEAGEPSVKTGSRSEPVNPAKRETRLKATTDRAFSSLSASNADVMKRLVYLAGRAERELIPIQSMASEHQRVASRADVLGHGAASDLVSTRSRLRVVSRRTWIADGMLAKRRVSKARRVDSSRQSFCSISFAGQSAGTKGCRDDATYSRFPPRAP